MSSRLRNAAVLVMAVALGGVSVVGCKSNAPAADNDRLPADVYAAMNRGDELINEGESLVEEGTKKGPDGADLVKQGEAKIAEGKKMKSTAAASVKK